jgi:hypothetical protein
VSPGHIGHGHAVGKVGHDGVVVHVERAVTEIGGLLQHRDHLRQNRRLIFSDRSGARAQVHVAPALEQVQADGLEQQLVGDWRGDLAVFLAQSREASIACGFRGDVGADVVRTVAPAVGLVGPGDLHLWRHLIRHADTAIELVALVDSALARIRDVQPFVRLELIEIAENRGLVLDLVVAGRKPEPHLVALERPADRSVEVVVLDDLVGHGQPRGSQLVAVVVALHAVVGEGQEARPGELVAAVARDEVDPHAAGGQVGRERCRVDGDLRRRSHVGRLTADVAAGLKGHRVDAIDGDALIRCAAAVSSQAAADILNLRAADVGGSVAARIRSRDHPRQRHVITGARQGIDDVGTEDALLCERARIDDRRFTGHRDRFFERADAHLGIEIRSRRPCQRDALALERVEPGQRERDHVHARAQIDQLIAAVAVRDDGPDFFNQHIAGGFDGDAREYGAGGVFHGAGD